MLIYQLQLTFYRETYQNSKEDMGSCFCFKNVSDVTPKPLDRNDIHQQFEIHLNERGCQGGGFVAKPIRPDGFPPQVPSKKRVGSAYLNS